MLKPSKTLLVFFVCLCLTGMIIVQVRAQGGTFETEILPSQGNANTIILIRIRTLNATVGPVDKADIFWDNSTITLLQQGMLGADSSYNYNVTVPNQPPLSDVGNHTIQARANVSNYGLVTFDFTFTITEFVPSPEYLVLNATYFSLLTNYTYLLDNYSARTAEYTALLGNYTALLGNLSQLLQNYNSLFANFNILSLNYNTLIKNYDALSSLPGNYTRLQANFESLSSNYDALRKDIDSLNSSYVSLGTSYDDAVGQLAFSRYLAYIFIASTIILAVTTFYFATRRQKTGLQKTSLRTKY
jgi:hypothetical protein